MTTVKVALRGGRFMDLPVIEQWNVWAITPWIDFDERVRDGAFTITHVPTGIAASASRKWPLGVAMRIGFEWARAYESFLADAPLGEMPRFDAASQLAGRDLLDALEAKHFPDGDEP